MTKQTGLIGGVEKRSIRIEDYDLEWPKRFNDHARRIRSALGASLIRIEHIGSTAVPGLAAKPIIDILLVVKNSADEDSYLPQLQSAGYVLRVREPDFHEHRMLRTPQRDVHVHVLSLGSPEIERYLVFRDQLRASTEDRKKYEAVKRRLASGDWPDMNSYADAKTEVIEQIIGQRGP